MKILQNKKTISLLGFVITLTSITAQADEASCVSFADFMKQSYNVSNISCSDLLDADAFSLDKKNAGKQAMPFKGQKYSVKMLQHLGSNILACGRDREVMHYQDKTGLTRTTDIGTDVFVKNSMVSADLILPVLPESLRDRADLNKAAARYSKAALTIAIGQEESESQLNEMKKGREEFWSQGLSAMMKDEGCAKTLCVFLGSVDPTGAATPECEKNLKKKSWDLAAADELFTKLQISRSPAIINPGSVNDMNAAKPQPGGSYTEKESAGSAARGSKTSGSLSGKP